MAAIGTGLQIAAYIYFGFAYYWYLPFILIGVSILPAFLGPIYQIFMMFAPLWPLAYLAAIYFEFFG